MQGIHRADSPVIGITNGVDPKVNNENYTAYSDAVILAGGSPEPLYPGLMESKGLSSILDGIHGLLLSGGRDVHPRYFLHSATEEELSRDVEDFHVKPDVPRDELELPLIRPALERGIPILGICRGFQVLNVALGGSLIMDIHTGMCHVSQGDDSPNPGQSRKHSVEIVPDTRIAGLLGTGEIMVNSRHHQGFTKQQMAGSLMATAYAPDGIVEAVELPGQPWVTAVQWHPERCEDAYVYEPCKVLFSVLVNEAARGIYSDG